MTATLEPEFDDVEVEMLPHQIDAVACECKFCGTRGGVGSAKTVAWCYWLWAGAEDYPRASHFVIGADYEQLRNGFFQTFIGILESKGLVEGVDYRYRASPSPMLTFLHNGARIRSLSSVLAERIRSIEIQRAVLEEPQVWNNGEVIYRVITGRLRHSPISGKLYPGMQTRLRMSFNPPAKSHWLFNLIENTWAHAPVVRCATCQRRDPGATGYPCFRFSVRDNVLLPDHQDYVKNTLEANYPAVLWPSEIDGHWKDVGGSVYSSFTRDTHTKPIAGLPPIAWDVRPDRPFWWALDFNVAWMASTFGQVYIQPVVTKGVKPITQYSTVLERIVGPQVDGWARRVHYVLGELFLPNSNATKVVEAFVERYRQITGPLFGQIPVWLYGDPSGGDRSQQIDSSNWKIIGGALMRCGIPVVWKVMLSHPRILDRVNAVNLQFREGELIGGRRGVLIDPMECPNFMHDLEAVQWSEKIENTIDKSDHSESGKKLTHLSDGYGYFAFVDRAEAGGQTFEFPNWMQR